MIDPVRLSHLRVVLRLIARRGPLVAGVVVFGAAVAVATLMSEPLRWRSVETLAVLEPRVDPRLATSGLPPISERLIEAARLDLLSHDKASEVISAYGLYPGNLSLDQKVEELRGDVSFETGLDSEGRPTRVTVSAVLAAPELAQSVTQEFAHRLIASVVRDRSTWCRTSSASPASSMWPLRSSRFATWCADTNPYAHDSWNGTVIRFR